TPRALPLQTDAFMAQHAPHRMHRAIERGGYRRTIPAGLARRRSAFQERQNSIAEIRAINRFGSGSRRIAQARESPLGEALTPFDHGVWTSVTDTGNFLNAFSSQTAQDNLSSFDHLFRFGPTASQPLQLLPVFRTTSNCGRISCHASYYTIYRISLQVSTSLAGS